MNCSPYIKSVLPCGHDGRLVTGGEEVTVLNTVLWRQFCSECRLPVDLVLRHTDDCPCSDCVKLRQSSKKKWVVSFNCRKYHKAEKETSIPCFCCGNTMLLVELSKEKYLYCEVVDIYINVKTPFAEYWMTKGEVLDGLSGCGDKETPA